MILLYICINLYSEEVFNDLPKWLNNPGMLLGVAILLVSVVVNLQRFVVRGLVNPTLSVDDQLKLLFYPISVYIALRAPLPLFLTIFKVQLGFEQGMIAALFQDLVATIVYFLALNNLSRHKLSRSPRFSFRVTAGCFLIFLIGGSIYGFFLMRGYWSA